MTTKTRSSDLFIDAEKILVGGVNSPVRAFKSVDSTPIFMKSGSGSKLMSEDGLEYIDYVLSYGPLILGHNDPDITKAIKEAAEKGTSFGAPTVKETELAKLIQDVYPSIEKLRFVNSGTEATMSAIRLARGVTDKKKLLKFDGCYHGHSDSLLVATGSGALTHANPDSLGVLEDTAKHTTVLPYNDSSGVTAYFKKHGHDIAAIIVEPVAGNMGVILPEPGFLETLRECCTKYESILIFDEVMCGFRLPEGGAQQYFKVTPDLTILGKVIGGGLPCGAYGGKAEIMNHLSPLGAVYQAGTLSGNPLVMAAGVTMLNKLKKEEILKKVCQNTQDLVSHLKESTPLQIQSCGTMFSLFFTSQKVRNLDEVKTCDLRKFKKFHSHLLNQGIYTPPSQFEANFTSVAHTKEDIIKTKEAINAFF
ncbi:glutamate-1-semialdehyde-2,1-aminomutase [Candidatus Marinamargulisbacteria bacterium SCGC AAA071-K20]|nr:glutamate-1-semialdehyde-2,1-aminomutase [Candidatus Marinamargulisbacteria bacterium SCGC AAA071-K20]